MWVQRAGTACCLLIKAWGDDWSACGNLKKKKEVPVLLQQWCTLFISWDKLHSGQCCALREGMLCKEADLEPTSAAFKYVWERIEWVCVNVPCVSIVVVSITLPPSGLLCDSATVLPVCWLFKRSNLVCFMLTRWHECRRTFVCLAH